MSTIVNTSIQENSLFKEASINLPTDNTKSTQYKDFIWTALRYTTNMTGLIPIFIDNDKLNWLHPGNFSTWMGGPGDPSPTLGQMVGFGRIFYGTFYALWALYSYKANWQQANSQIEKDRLNEQFIQKFTHGMGHSLRGFGELFTLGIACIIYDLAIQFGASKEHRDLASFWSSKPLGFDIKADDLQTVDINSGKFFGKKLNLLGSIPGIGYIIGLPRLPYAIFLQLQTTFTLIKNSQNTNLDQRKVKQEFVTNTWYNLVHFIRALGEIFTVGVGCLIYDFMRNQSSEEFKNENPHVIDFFAEPKTI